MPQNDQQKEITPPEDSGAPRVEPPEDEGAPGKCDPRWHSRDYLPHCEHPDLIQGITFRLVDAMPQSVLDRLTMELLPLSESQRDTARRKRVEAYLDAGHGACWLRDPRIAKIMQDALLHLDGQRYRLFAWCVMPNHVHVIAQIIADHTLGDVIYSWKSWVAKQANKLLGRSGSFWQREYHDRYMRDERHLADAIRYVEENPLKAGLVKRAENWPWSSAGSAAILVRRLKPLA